MEATNSKRIDAGVNLNYFYIFSTGTFIVSFHFPRTEVFQKSTVILSELWCLFGPLPLNQANPPDQLHPPFQPLSRFWSDLRLSLRPTPIPWFLLPPALQGPWASLGLPNPALEFLAVAPSRDFRGEGSTKFFGLAGPGWRILPSLPLSLNHTTPKFRLPLQWQSWGIKDAWALFYALKLVGSRSFRGGGRVLEHEDSGRQGTWSIRWAKPKMKGTCAKTVHVGDLRSEEESEVQQGL